RTPHPPTSTLFPYTTLFRSHMNYDGARHIITLRDSYFRTPQTLIGIHGSVSDRSDLRIQAKTGDLNELNSLAAALQTPNNQTARDRKSTRLNSSHVAISYAV